jgi:hypothetical protein
MENALFQSGENAQPFLHLKLINGSWGASHQFFPPVQPSTQTHVQFAINWHGFCPASSPTIQLSTKVHVQSAICWHGFCPTPLGLTLDKKYVITKSGSPFPFPFLWHYCSYLIRLERCFMSITSQQYLPRSFISDKKKESLYLCCLDITFLR